MGLMDGITYNKVPDSTSPVGNTPRKEKIVRLHNLKTGKTVEFPYGEPGYPIPQVLWFLEQCGLAEVVEDVKPVEIKPREVKWKVDKHTGPFLTKFVLASCTRCGNSTNTEMVNRSYNEKGAVRAVPLSKEAIERITFKCPCSKEPVPIPADILKQIQEA